MFASNKDKLEILIVDDVKDNLLALNALLARDDINIFQALSGNEALDLMLEHDFCLALLDVQMPIMNGFELAELMRGTKKTKNIPIIFVTGIAKDQTHVFKGYESGAVDFLRKPLDTHTVKSKVNIFLELHQQKIELKNTAKELYQLNRTLKASMNIMHAIMHVNKEKDYLNEVCRVIVEDCGHVMVWIGYAENDDQKTIRPVASAGFDEDYLEKLKLVWMDTERGRGPTGNTLRSGKMTICRNMLTDPEFGPWREEALKRGYASSVVFPFNHDGKTFGALTIYSKMPDPFSVAELELLGELTNRLVYGIVMLRLRAEKEKLDEARLQDQIEITNLHKNLQHKMKKVEKSNQELEAFNSSVSHDLSAPLHAITAFSQIIFDDHDQNLSLVSQDALGRVINNAKTMGHVIEGLLEISDIKNIEIVRNRVNISMLVDEIATELQGSTPDREVDFIIAKNIMADCDPNILSIIMNNLMRNSYKFTSKKAEAIIEFGIEKEIYFLRDNGAGFDMRHKDKLFGAFERLHTVHEFPGTGIGLATVLRGIRRHQGLIWAEAEVDKGATFFFTLGK